MRLRNLALLIILFFCLSATIEADPGPAVRKGEIVGRVVAAADGTPLVGATVTMVGRFGGTIADTVGEYRLANLPSGIYTLRFSHVGYEDSQLTSVQLAAGESLTLSAALVEKLTTLRGIVVTPGQFEIMGGEPTAQQTLTRGEIETVPQLGDDFFRAVTRLPGMSGNDFSTRFVVRGGEYDEVLVTLDGLQIYEPFHLRDIDGGAISVVDVAAVEGIDLMTGGFAANHGDKMSGVFNITSKQIPAGHSRLTVGLSMLNARFFSEGTYANDRGSWLLSARRGYIDLVLKLADPESKLKPTYYDIFTKTRYQLSDKQILGANILHAGDDLHYFGEDDEAGDTLRTNYGNSYGWLTLWSEFHRRVTARTMLAAGQVTHDRSGQLYDTWVSGTELAADDSERFRFVGLKSDWEYDLSDNFFLRFGADVKWMTAEYDYLSELYRYGYHLVGDSSYITLDGIDTTAADMKPSGEKLGAYVTSRCRLGSPVTMEFGLRYDRATHSGDDLVSPRLALVYDAGAATTLRAGWGRYHQFEGIDEIMVGDGETEYYPAERADHWVAGLQHDFDNGVHLRAEAYYKKYSSLRPDYRNSFDDIEAFPELEDDRTVVYRDGSSSRGLECYLEQDTRGKVSWWASYALARFEDEVGKIRFTPEDVTVKYDRKLPTPNDQRHTLYFDLSYRPSNKWQLNFAVQFHTGWPYTGVHTEEVPIEGGTLIYLQSDDQLSSRHSNYRRMDLRINRYFRVGRGRITAFVELINVFGFDNVRGYSYDIRLGGPNGYFVDSEAEHWFGRLPSFGVAYEVTL